MQIIVIFVFIVLAVCAIHSYTRKDAPREPFEFYIDIDGEEE